MKKGATSSAGPARPDVVARLAGRAESRRPALPSGVGRRFLESLDGYDRAALERVVEDFVEAVDEVRDMMSFLADCEELERVDAMAYLWATELGREEILEKLSTWRSFFESCGALEREV